MYRQTCTLVLAAVCLVCGCSEEPKELAVQVIPYQVVKQWNIPNGGYGQIIVIDPKYKNEKEMRRLGKQLEIATHKNRHAVFQIYDDKVAAENSDEAFGERLGEEELAHHDAHLIGVYNRNGNTGDHRIVIMLEGISGEVIEVHMWVGLETLSRSNCLDRLLRKRAVVGTSRLAREVIGF